MAGIFSRIANRLKPRRVWIADDAIHYTAAGRQTRLPIAAVTQINVYPNFEPPSRKFGIVYSGSNASITTVEDMEGFIDVFRTVLDTLELDTETIIRQISDRRHRNPVFERKSTVTRQ